MNKIKHKPLAPEFDQSTYVTLVLSVSHVALEDQESLHFIDKSRYGNANRHELCDRLFARDSGFFVKLMSCEDELDVKTELAAFNNAGFSTDFLTIIEYALYANVLMLEFDTDADVSDRFAEFDV